MKNIVFIFLSFLFFFSPLHSQQFHSLDGIESPIGQTILLYRLGTEQYNSNPIFKFNLQTGYEQQIMDAHEIYFPVGADIKTVNDYEFFPGDTANFINVGDLIFMDYSFYIAKNDSVVFSHFAPYYRVDISKQNPEKIFVFGSGGEIRSWDGGYTFPLDSIYPVANFMPIALADFDDEVMFGFDEELDFCKNGGVVDTAYVGFDIYSKMLFDVNQFHIYRVNWTYGGYSLNVSNNKGNAFTWTKTYQSENPIYVAIDSTQSGVVYLADGRKIYKSINNGYTFSEYKSLPSKLVGIYKKPNSEILYAASKKMIFKITPDSTKIIKSIPLTAEEYSWFPLAIGNKWIYRAASLEENCFWIINEWEESNTITKDTIIHGFKYYKFEPPLSNECEFIRIDSIEGKIKAIFSYADSAEVTLYNFYMEVGDTVIFDPSDPHQGFILTEETTDLVFGESRLMRNFNAISFLPPPFTLVKGLGYFRDSFCEFGGFIRRLKGCVINDVVYGDTTFVVDVEEENNPIPTEYKLKQNYPNPFNSSSVIKYSVPKSSQVSLKIFNTLGEVIETLVNEEKSAGTYELTWNAANLPSGVYFYRLQAGNFVQTRKMILLK